MDEGYSELLRTIRAGFPNVARLAVATVLFWQCHHGVWELAGEAIFQDRVVMPE